MAYPTSGGNNLAYLSAVLIHCLEHSKFIDVLIVI